MRSSIRRQARLVSCALATVVLATAATSTVAQQRVHETVVVTGTAAPTSFDTLSRSVRVISRDELERLPVASIADALRLVAGVDVRSRGTHGVQSDLALRGANFAQALVLVDGVRLNNVQTAHHNGDWPVTLEQVERIEVLLGPGSSIHGADAFGGAVNIVTRRAAAAPSFSLAAGAHGLVSGSGAAGFTTGRVSQRLSLAAARSSGFEFDRDFRTVTIASRSAIGSRTVADVGISDKEFGASGFYGNSPSKEWTRQFTAALTRTLVQAAGRSVAAEVSFRSHSDRFLWDVRRPGVFENRHRTHAVQAAVRGHLQATTRWRLAGGLEQAGDWLRSSNLGDHAVARTGAYAELQATLGPRATLTTGLRMDRYSTFGTAWNPSFGASAWVSSSVRVRGSLSRAFRVPSFTERYYRDPAHLADASLAPERAWGGEVAADWVPHQDWLVTATVFDRRERGAIDWVKARPEDVWRTRNVRRVTTRGGEFGVRRLFGNGARLSVEYAYTDVAPDGLSLISKYTLDYARHALTVGASTALPGGFAVGGRLDVRERTGRDPYALVDLRVSRDFGGITAYLEGTNLLDADYQEIRGVNMPGRWMTAGVGWRPK